MSHHGHISPDWVDSGEDELDRVVREGALKHPETAYLFIVLMHDLGGDNILVFDQHLEGVGQS